MMRKEARSHINDALKPVVGVAGTGESGIVKVARELLKAALSRGRAVANFCFVLGFGAKSSHKFLFSYVLHVLLICHLCVICHCVFCC